MAKWQCNDLSTAAKPPAQVAAGDPIGYGVPVCDPGGFDEIASDACAIRIPRVVYRGVDNNIYELNLNGQWQSNNLSAIATFWRGGSGRGAPPALSDPTAYVSVGCNGVARVNYLSESGGICQLALFESGWVYGEPSNNDRGTAPAPPAGGRAFGYWDYDNNFDRIVYLGALPNNNNIYELSDQKNETWVCGILSTSISDRSGQPPSQPAAGNPFGYTYGGVPRVVYPGIDGHIWEAHLESSGWKWADLTRASGGAPQAAGDPYAYTPGSARVIYRDTGGQIIELGLGPSGWTPLNLSADEPGRLAPAAVGNPCGYATFDGTLRVVYRDREGHIQELNSTNGVSWISADLSIAANATSHEQIAAGDPFGYEAGDGVPRVVYRGINDHIWELALF